MSLMSGVVHEAGGGVYSIVLDSGDRLEASIRGRLKQEARTGSRVVIGDRVLVAVDGSTATIEEVEARRSELVRRGRGRGAKILAANLDRVFVVVAVSEPRGSTQLIDRMLVLVESSGMRPTLIINKVDLPDVMQTARSWAELYGAIGYTVHLTSASSGAGIDALHAELCEGLSAMIGPSGGGKSSLLNAVDPELELRTGGLSRKTGTGRHTTVGSRLIELACGGLVADTPGFGDVGLWSVDPDQLSACFPEFASLEGSCRFRGCTHVHEPDCAVLQAVADGQIDQLRHDSYVRLHAEAEADRVENY